MTSTLFVISEMVTIISLCLKTNGQLLRPSNCHACFRLESFFNNRSTRPSIPRENKIWSHYRIIKSLLPPSQPPLTDNIIVNNWGHLKAYQWFPNESLLATIISGVDDFVNCSDWFTILPRISKCCWRALKSQNSYAAAAVVVAVVRWN